MNATTDPMQEFELVAKTVIHKTGEEIASLLPDASYGAGFTITMEHEAINDRVAVVVQAAALLVLRELDALFAAFDGAIDTEESQKGYEYARTVIARYDAIANGDHEWIKNKDGGIV